MGTLLPTCFVNIRLKYHIPFIDTDLLGFTGPKLDPDVLLGQGLVFRSPRQKLCYT